MQPIEFRPAAKTKFKMFDEAMYLEPNVKDKMSFVKVQITSVRPRDPIMPFYEIRFLKGRSRLQISHAFENQLFTDEEAEEMLVAEDEQPAS